MMLRELAVVCRGDQFIHLKVRIPKEINERQKELLKEFEDEFHDKEEDDKDSKKSKDSDESCVNSAWQRIKDFMKK